LPAPGPPSINTTRCCDLCDNTDVSTYGIDPNEDIKVEFDVMDLAAFAAFTISEESRFKSLDDKVAFVALVEDEYGTYD
jgi:hypothetical protein